ncbi:hypothetical protein [Aeromonas taiwanensis]|uniref:hypothetical protein n=1 Tax=Aeromonas taiwanensis TaxID=633417 RepID=UPI00106F752B|nr:hypothetical protein [Aeromonas taiwanensis]
MNSIAKKELIILIVSIMENALNNLAKDPELMADILDKAKSIDDWLQEKLGCINKPNTEESIKLAIETSIARDKETICSIIAVITTLYATRSVVRGANIGGTLLKEFGEDVFPHIAEHELRYAKHVNPQIKEHIQLYVLDSFDETMSKYDFDKHVDFSKLGIQAGYSYWASASCVSVHGLTKILLSHGPRALKAIKSLLRMSVT